jgi:acetyl-CoA synthetase
VTIDQPAENLVNTEQKSRFRFVEIGYEVSIRDTISSERTDVGELCVETGEMPVGLMAGYLDGTSLILPPMGRERVYRTGDMAEQDEEGRIRILGRIDDVFKSFGHRVSPYELERLLLLHPDVDAAAVVPLPHPVGGSVPHAVIVGSAACPRSDDDLAADVLDHMGKQVQGGCHLYSIDIVDDLPRTGTGKVLRNAIVRTARPLGSARTPILDQSDRAGSDRRQQNFR